jgi:DNA-binding response OmpR family regulator
MKDGRILLVDKMRTSRRLAATYLNKTGHSVTEASTPREARGKARLDGIDLVILDVHPDDEVAAHMLAVDVSLGGIPIIVLCESSRPEERIAWLERGARDVLSKPIHLRELQLRIANVPSPRNIIATQLHADMACGNIRLDVAKRILKGTDKTVALTASEFRLLLLLLKNESTLVERQAISRDALGYEYEETSRSVDVMVSKLRRKLKFIGANRFIRSIRSEGYLLIQDERKNPRPDEPAPNKSSPSLLIQTDNS